MSSVTRNGLFLASPITWLWPQGREHPRHHDLLASSVIPFCSVGPHPHSCPKEPNNRETHTVKDVYRRLSPRWVLSPLGCGNTDWKGRRTAASTADSRAASYRGALRSALGDPPEMRLRAEQSYFYLPACTKWFH